MKYMDEEDDWMYSFVLQYDKGRNRLSGNQVKDLAYIKLIPIPQFGTYPARNMTGQDIRVPETLANTEVKLFSIRANPEIFYIKCLRFGMASTTSKASDPSSAKGLFIVISKGAAAWLVIKFHKRSPSIEKGFGWMDLAGLGA